MLANVGVKRIGYLLQAKKSRPEALSSVKTTVESSTIATHQQTRRRQNEMVVIR